ncbi:hypothetical protein [Halobellus inordinatus]|uniref:hypothetical protein n=1 Tax=Halobellus inordinatus TaxID=1126236 RepID=UPI002108F56F|nr:hypothetical protein [Halobellus inordinatus]
MAVNVRLVAVGALLLVASSGLLFETGVSNLLAAAVAAIAVAGSALAFLRAGTGDARAA